MATKKIAAKKVTKCATPAKTKTFHLTIDCGEYLIKAHRTLVIPHDMDLMQYLANDPPGGFSVLKDMKNSRFANVHLSWSGLLNKEGQRLRSMTWVVRRFNKLLDAGWVIQRG